MTVDVMQSALLFSDHKSIVGALLQWFRATKRDLPWRRTYNPYHVWISEIMLQQTQMDRGVRYFLRWVERFPDVFHVARASEQEILKYWEGLGYYTRARNLHRTAKIFVEKYDGEVPCQYDILLTLPGIGPYTAAAIASVAGNYDIPVIDANVTRVYARLFNIDTQIKERKAQNYLKKIAVDLLPMGQARAYNQAMMDLGGLVCTPKNPRCSSCPVAMFCMAFKLGTVADRPLVAKPKKTISLTKVAGIIYSNGRIFIQQRKPENVWGGLWEFPGGTIAGQKPHDQVAEKIFEDIALAVSSIAFIAKVKHQYTHHKITLHCFLCTLKEENQTPVLNSACDYKWILPEEIESYGFPAGPRKIIEYMQANTPKRGMNSGGMNSFTKFLLKKQELIF